jgi:hypothetical protein
MPVNRTVWSRLASKGSIPSLPCSSCANGKLKLIKDGLNVLTPKYQSDYLRSEDWDPYNVVERWSATLRCDEAECGEIVHMIGDSEPVETEVEISKGNFTWGLEDVLRIQAVFPAPPLFHISDSVPRRVEQQLQIAFRMYWTDVSACVARLRTAVEALLDHQKVPKEKKLTNGKMHRMGLKERIDAFSNGAIHQDQLQGLRNIGNLGTHGTNDVTDEDLFDALDVLQFVLTGIYDTQTINAKAKKLEDKKPGA